MEEKKKKSLHQDQDIRMSSKGIQSRSELYGRLQSALTHLSQVITSKNYGADMTSSKRGLQYS